MILISYHGTAPGNALIGERDPVSSRQLECLWVGSSYFMAAQFQDGQVRKLEIEFERPLFITPDEHQNVWNGSGHARIVDTIMMRVTDGTLVCDGVIFLDTVDGMEFGDVAAAFPAPGQDRSAFLDRIKLIGARTYDDIADSWMSDEGFAIELYQGLSDAKENWSALLVAHDVSETDFKPY